MQGALGQGCKPTTDEGLRQRVKPVARGPTKATKTFQQAPVHIFLGIGISSGRAHVEVLWSYILLSPVGMEEFHKFSKQDVALTDDLESLNVDAIDSRGFLGGCSRDGIVNLVL